MSSDTFAALRRAAFADGLTDEELALIVPICRVLHVSSGVELFSEDSHGRELYVVCDGRVAIEVVLPNQPTRHRERLATATPGMVIGEIALVDGSPRSALARTIEEATLLEIPAEDFRRVMETHFHIGYVIMRNLATVLSTRLRSTNLWLRNELL